MHVRDIGRTEPKIYRVFIAITLLPLLRSDGHDAKADAAQKEHKNSTTVSEGMVGCVYAKNENKFRLGNPIR